MPDTSPLCERCQKQLATETYTSAGRTLMLCATCLDRMTVQDALENGSAHIFDLQSREQYDEALAGLDEILEANRHRDHEKWLARSVAMHRAHFLFEAGRYAEAELAGKAWGDLGFEDAWYRWSHGSLMSDTLDELGRAREGLVALEDALSYRDPRYVEDAWVYLKDLVRLSGKLGQEVDPKWRSLAQEVAERYGVEMPKHEALGKAILALTEAIREVRRVRYNEEEPTDDQEE